MRKFVTN